MNIEQTHQPSFEENNLEDMKKNAPLFFIYRDNTLFRNHIPIILRKLTEMGRQVGIQSFSEETSEKDIDRWYEDNKGPLAKKAIVSDWTAQMRSNIQPVGAVEVEQIDNLIDKVSLGILFGDNKPELTDYGRLGKGDIETSRGSMVTIVKNIIRDHNQCPKKVKIISNHMLDHIIAFDKDFDTEKNDNSDDENYVTAKIKEWLIESGVEAQNIEIVTPKIYNSSGCRLSGYHFSSEYRGKFAGDEKEFLNEIDKPGTWIIADRHTRISRDPSKTNVPIRSSVLLTMPLGNFFKDARDQNLISYSDEEIEKEWGRVLEKEFSKKE